MDVIQRIHHQPPPNVYFAAIHLLLMEGRSPDLAAFYPSLVDDPLPIAGVAPVFTEFVVSHAAEIVELANTRYTQTNECRRCVALMPAMMTAPFDGFHVVDLGTSAGLNLAFDRYRYEYGDFSWGPISPVTLNAESRGDRPRTRDVELGRRIGIDLNIVDPADPTDRLWLEALIWPEHDERRRRLRSALEIAGGVDMELIEGSFLDVLGEVLSGLPAGEPVVVMNSFSLIQLDEAQRDQIAVSIGEARSKREIYRVSLELIDKTDMWARLEVGDGLDMMQLGTAQPHGEWVDLDYQVLP